MKYLYIIVVLLSGLSINLSAQLSFGKSESLNNDWQFISNDLDRGNQSEFEKNEWVRIDLPHDWSVQEQLSPSLASATGYLPGGVGWYRKSINIPQSKEGEKVYIYFEGIYNRSEVYINGHLLGKRANGYISFSYDLTPYVKFGQDNVITVRVDHSQSADSRWYTGSGIYRNVWLTYASQVHISQWGVKVQPSQVTKTKGVMDIEISIENNFDKASNLTVINELISAEGGLSVAKSSQKIKIGAGEVYKYCNQLKVNNPLLWDVTTPNLYVLKTTILDGQKILDYTTTTTGFRTFVFDANKGFFLNGQSMKMKGVCIHHDAGVLGSAVPREVWKRRLITLKEVGVNAIRTSHNPQSPDLYHLCDELGLLVLNEAYDEWTFAKRKWIDGWNVGKPGYQGSFDFFDEWGEKDIEDMVRRDRNHISIFAWSIGNEVDYPNDPYSHPILDGNTGGDFVQPIFGGYRKDAPNATQLGIIAKKLAQAVKKHDTSRPVTAGLAGVVMSNETEYPDALDIVGYNYTEPRYDLDHAKYPNRVIYGSETRHELDKWKYVRDKEFIFGQFLWTGIDYLGESGRWPSRGFYSGLLDFGGFIKPRGYYRKSIWNDMPMAYIGSYPISEGGLKDVWSQQISQGEQEVEKTPSMDAWPLWNYDEGQIIRVVCYTNATKAKLELNGKTVGEKKPYDDETGIIYWDIPYEEGKLEVVGFDSNDKELVRNAIHSSKQPHAIQIISADKLIAKNGVAQITIQLVDEENNPVTLADNEITCNILGNGKLLGMEAGNNEDMTDYTDNIHRVYHGKMIVYIKAKNEEGAIKVKLSSPWLRSTEVNIEVQ